MQSSCEPLLELSPPLLGTLCVPVLLCESAFVFVVLFAVFFLPDDLPELELLPELEEDGCEELPELWERLLLELL